MDEEEFIDAVRQEGSIESEDGARAVTAATLQTLGERITDGEAEDLARHLPDGLARVLTDVPGEAEPFGLDEFEARVSDRAGIDTDRVAEQSGAVATALSRAAGGELDLAREQLPPEFDVIFEPRGPKTADEFVATVRERAGLDSDEAAESATVATLRTLGERLSGGQAADLAHYLPDRFAEELAGTGEPAATDDSFDEFVARLAQRESVEKDEARTHARAVGSTLADAASTREVDAARKQLPDPFGVIFEPPE